MEDVLRPAVDAARHAAEAVLQRQRDADPVVRLELRHRDDDLRLAEDARDPELAQPRVRGAERCPDERGVVQVDEREPRVGERLVHAPTRAATASVSRRCPGPSATTTEDAPRRRSVFAAATTRRGSVLIDEPAAILDEVRLEEHRAAAHVRLRRVVSAVEQQALEVAVVALRAEDRDGRLPRLGKLRAVERRRRVEHAEPVGGDRAAGTEPGGRERRSGRAAVGGSCSRARPQRLEERVGPGREGAPTRGRADGWRTHGPRHEPPRAPRAAAATRRAPWSRNASSALRERQPAGLEAPRVGEVAQRRPHEPLRCALEGDQRDRGGLRVARAGRRRRPTRCRSSSRRPRTGGRRAGRAPRPASRGRPACSAFTARRTRAVGSTSERVSVVQPQATRRSGSSALGSGSPRPAIA